MLLIFSWEVVWSFFLSDFEVRTGHVTLTLFVRLWGKDWSRDPVTFASLLIFYVKNEVNFIFKSSYLWFHLPEEDFHQGSRLLKATHQLADRKRFTANQGKQNLGNHEVILRPGP